MERADYNGLWSDSAPTDILKLILSRLIAGDYFVFRAVCKRWRLIESPPHPLPPSPLPPLEYDSSSSYRKSPCFMTLKRTGVVEFFHPLYNTLTHKMDFPELRDCRIRCSKANWLLMSLRDRIMFFFNPISKVKIELPDLPELAVLSSLSGWTFSCPPDSSLSSCFVVGLSMVGSPPPVCIIKVGETRWTYHDFPGPNQRIFTLPWGNNPIFFKNNTVCVLKGRGKLGVLSINENSTAETPTWEYYGEQFSRKKRNSIHQVLMAEDVDNGGILCVFVTHEEGQLEVWRFNMIERVFKKEQVPNLNNKTLFVSRGASYLKPCIAPGLENKIYVPMFRDNNKGVFYSLACGRYYSFDYSVNQTFSSRNCFNLDQPRNGIWIEPDVSQSLSS